MSAEVATRTLLAQLIDADGYEACCPNDGEDPRTALECLRPRLVFLDADRMPASARDEFLAQADAQRAMVVLFGSARNEGGLRRTAAALGVTYLSFPIARGAIARLIQQAGTHTPVELPAFQGPGRRDRAG